MRTILLAMLVAAGIGLAGISGVSAVPVNGAVIDDLAKAADSVGAERAIDCRRDRGDGVLDGSIIAFDDQTLEVLWRINVGSGINAPPMTYSVNGKQYVAIASGPCCVRPSGQIANSKSRIARTPELRDMSQATVLYVFGL
jgi:hypothetical protein